VGVKLKSLLLRFWGNDWKRGLPVIEPDMNDPAIAAAVERGRANAPREVLTLRQVISASAIASDGPKHTKSEEGR
jgi:hypothetical protein